MRRVRDLLVVEAVGLSEAEEGVEGEDVVALVVVEAGEVEEGTNCLCPFYTSGYIWTIVDPQGKSVVRPDNTGSPTMRFRMQ
jgi:hypothetical protein